MEIFSNQKGVKQMIIDFRVATLCLISVSKLLLTGTVYIYIYIYIFFLQVAGLK